jgi:hypothetical protein
MEADGNSTVIYQSLSGGMLSEGSGL